MKKKNRIYFFVPRCLQVVPGCSVMMPPGRMAAQVSHLTARIAREFKDVHNMYALILEIQNEDYFFDVRDCLFKHRIDFFEQRDDFQPITSERILQAIATAPISKLQAEKSFSNFRLWA